MIIKASVAEGDTIHVGFNKEEQKLSIAWSITQYRRGWDAGQFHTAMSLKETIVGFTDLAHCDNRGE
jgi:hypothetical protein